MIRLAVPVLLFGLAGCTHPETAAASKDPAAPGVECDANKVQDVVGKMKTDAIGADAQKRAGAHDLRWIPFGSMVTMDFRPDRLNLKLDPKDKITEATCG